MKKNSSEKRSQLDSLQTSAPDKVGWIRKFCGKGIFREIWKNRFVVLRGNQLFICEKEVKELGRADEVLDLSDYERCEEIRKNKSRSKKNHSKFRLQRCSSPGNTATNMVFLAVSPEDKESWINILNTAITRAKNRILDEVTVQDSQLSHLTRDRVKIPHNRRLPTRGHLLAVASTSSPDGVLTLDLIQEEDTASHLGLDMGFREDPESLLGPDCPRSRTDGELSARAAEPSGKSQSLPRETVVWEKAGQVQTSPSDQRPPTAEKNRCSSMDEILTPSESKSTKTRTPVTSPRSGSAPSDPTAPISRLQELISQNLERTERLLTEVRADGEPAKSSGVKVSPEGAQAQTQRLLQEAVDTWNQAQEVLEEVKELRALYRQLDSSSSWSPSNSSKLSQNCKSLM
ncbi:pleckstrin homology domain-containing family O member 1b [Austrofundulus limnaeus]|uniref:Pleckstrin homology domain-containing family O member 1b n=1 Tax=Austrofundulus limnaeus TaxID=52670 RepID=A0A2I4D8A8_AUSLI|nr:PREDICTED: pleckstrin homology domain-containing family O member 1-like [Austrofundulus limnaeus]